MGLRLLLPYNSVGHSQYTHCRVLDIEDVLAIVPYADDTGVGLVSISRHSDVHGGYEVLPIGSKLVNYAYIPGQPHDLK